MGHMDGFTADRVCPFFAQVIAACIQGRIVPVIGACNNIVAAGDPLRYRLGNSVGFLVNRGYRFFNGFEFLLGAVQVVGNGCGGFFQAADFRFDLIRRLGDQAFGAFLCYVVPAAGCPRGRRIAVLQHGVKQRKLVGVAAAIPRPYAAAAKLDRVQNTRSVGCPCAIPQHPSVCLLNFKLIFGGYAGIVRISVVGGIRKAQAQPVGAGNWFVHDGQAQGNAFGNASATGIENKIPIGTCVCYGRAAGIVVRGRTAADRVTSQFSVLEALTAQDQVPAAGDFGVFFHLRGKPVYRCFQVGVLAGQVAGLYFQAVHAGLDLQHFAGQVFVALAVHGAGTFPAGAAHALKAGFAGGDCGAHQVGVELPPACVLNVHDLPAGKAGAAGHGHFAGGVGHVFQHVVQVLGNAFQVGFGAGCQQQIALHCVSVGSGGAVGVDERKQNVCKGTCNSGKKKQLPTVYLAMQKNGNPVERTHVNNCVKEIHMN